MNKKQKILFVLIIIIAAFLRLYNITEVPPGLYPDEAMNGNNALEALSPNGHFSAFGGPASGWKVFYPENNGREGLFINIQAVSVKVFGNEPWALRIVSAFFGIFTVLGIYFLTKELINFPKTHLLEKTKINISLLAAFFLAASFWHVNFSRIGFRAIMAPFFSVWGIYFLLRALNRDKYLLSSIIGGIIFGMGLNSYIAYRAMPALVFVIALIYWFKEKESRKKLIISVICFSFMAALMFAPLGFYFLNNPQEFFGRTTQVSIMSSSTPLKDLGMNILKTAGMFNFFGDWNWRHNYAGKPELSWLVGIMFLVGIFIGLKMFFKKVSRRLSGQGFAKSEERSRESSVPTGCRDGTRDHVFREEYFQSFLILFSWLIIAALPVVISNEGLPHALRAIIMIPPVMILSAIGGYYAYNFIKNSLKENRVRYFNIVCGFALFAVFVNAYSNYFEKWAKNPNTQGAFSANYAELGRGLNKLPKDMPKYVIVEASGVDVRGIPMPAQTVMFLTDTFTPEKQQQKNLYYILPGQESQIPAEAYVTYVK